MPVALKQFDQVRLAATIGKIVGGVAIAATRHYVHVAFLLGETIRVQTYPKDTGGMSWELVLIGDTKVDSIPDLSKNWREHLFVAHHKSDNQAQVQLSTDLGKSFAAVASQPMRFPRVIANYWGSLMAGWDTGQLKVYQGDPYFQGQSQVLALTADDWPPALREDPAGVVTLVYRQDNILLRVWGRAGRLWSDPVPYLAGEDFLALAFSPLAGAFVGYVDTGPKAYRALGDRVSSPVLVKDPVPVTVPQQFLGIDTDQDGTIWLAGLDSEDQVRIYYSRSLGMAWGTRL